MLPAGYISSSDASVSSLSIGELTNDLSDVDDLDEMANDWPVLAGFSRPGGSVGYSPSTADWGPEYHAPAWYLGSSGGGGE